jgi:hypothetical protein
LVEVVPANFPRFDHRYVNGEIESLGLLIEEQRQNLINYSNNYSSSPGGWVFEGTGTRTQDLVGPDGVVNSAWTIVDDDATGDFIRFYKTVAITASSSTNYCISSFIKPISTTKIELYAFFTGSSTKGSLISYNPSTGAITPFSGDGGGIVPSIYGRIFYPNGWIRIYFVVNDANSGANTNLQYRIYPGGRNASENGSIGFYGSQIEIGTFPTSYIPTSGSTVTRTADNASMTGTNFSNWYNPSESTFFVSFRQIYDASATVPPKTPHVLQIGNTTTVNDNYTIRAGQTSTRWDCLIRSASPSSLQFPGISNVGYLNSTTQYKSALSVSSSLISVSLNGLISADNANTTTVNHTTQFNKLFIGSGTGGSPPYELCGHISQLIYYPTRLSNAQLVSLTR